MEEDDGESVRCVQCVQVKIIGSIHIFSCKILWVVCAMCSGQKRESIHIFSFKKLWVECAVCAMCAGENNRHIYSCHSGWFGLMWVECAVCAVCAGEKNMDALYILSGKMLWVECAVCAMCAGENNRHI